MAKALSSNPSFLGNKEGYSKRLGFKIIGLPKTHIKEVNPPVARSLTICSLMDYWKKQKGYIVRG